MAHAEALATLRERLAAAPRWCVLSGAGMSAESGIATFRDAMSGLWSRFDPMQLASEAGFRADPARVWDWYAERRAGVRAAQPNAGHRALGAYAQRHPGRLTVITQNVDDLHQRAGNTDALRLHGDVLGERWLDRCRRDPGCHPDWALAGSPPHCERCGNLVRPDVVWFGEPLPLAVFDAAQRAVDAAAVLLVVGTSGAVWPAAGLVARAHRAGAWVAILNPEASEVDDEADQCLRGTAATLLPALLDGL
ncbi:NAD-dependent deacylase [Ideonella sp. DXS22W]|uniref:NAD-dependent protein deacylase n=1 Tax=Pseudaquabacterium inlustre TaxID=2984192 RepID=A0ABU9CJD4_9BURK